MQTQQMKMKEKKTQETKNKKESKHNLKFKITKLEKKFGGKKAQEYGEELERIQEANGGILTPPLVIAEAKNESSPLHDYFEWDRNSAHAKYLLHQARILIASIEVMISYDGEEKKIRRYLNVTKHFDDDDGEETMRVYAITEKVLSNTELREQILKGAIREAEYWAEKYRTYNELTPVFNVIEKVKDKIL